MEDNLKCTARKVGILYLILAISGALSIMYIPSTLIDWTNASVTYENIKENELLYRFGIVLGFVCQISFLLLPLALYKLLSSVNKKLAILMVTFALISIPTYFVIIFYQFDVLHLIQGHEYIKVMDQSIIEYDMMNLLFSVQQGVIGVSVFWGLWLFPFGMLVYTSGFLPKILGVFLMIGCFGYVIDSLCQFLIPTVYSASGVTDLIHIPSSIGELGICLYLVFVGVKQV